ncbi:hypothetical protein EII17_08705 [Clostridiales bacterium COT073_COT-073]|nr:hypothetical protein EII17_08705 [Clostridiales bacterium COT073_COT-073]
MNQITQMSHEYGKDLAIKNDVSKREEKNKAKTEEKNAAELSATLELSSSAQSNQLYFKPDLNKIRQMQAESQQRMLEKMLGTARETFIKQAGGLKNILEQALSGKPVEGFDLKIGPEDIEKAKADVAEGGYWSAESTAGRLVEFARALAGGDPARADQLMGAIKKGFQQAEELWGSALPQISQDTYRLTMEKMENWKKEFE